VKSNLHTRASGSGNSGRSAVNGALPYMSERQTQAYLIARDTIRRIQRTSSIFDSISKESVPGLEGANQRRNIH